MRTEEASEKFCPIIKDKCETDNCMAWMNDGYTQEGEYMERYEVYHGHCNIIHKKRIK